jgi:hypothetical protein
MRQSRSLALQAFNRPRRLDSFRRSTWTPRRVYRPAAPVEKPVAEVPNEAAAFVSRVPGEFIEPIRSPVLAGLRRSICLAWDVSLLTALSPFFLGWFCYRGGLWARAAFAARNK